MLYTPQPMLRETKTTVSPSKSKAVGKRHTNATFLCLIRRVVTVKPVVQSVQVDGRGHDILKDN